MKETQAKKKNIYVEKLNKFYARKRIRDSIKKILPLILISGCALWVIISSIR